MKLSLCHYSELRCYAGFETQQAPSKRVSVKHSVSKPLNPETHVRYGKHGAEIDVGPVGPCQGCRGYVLLGDCHLRRLTYACIQVRHSSHPQEATRNDM